MIQELHKAFDHRIRLGIMSALMVNESLSFNELKHLLNITDGNLASHIKPLEEAQYISIKKSFIGKKPNTEYALTPLGSTEFKKHLEALEKIIKQSGLSSPKSST